MVRPLWLLAVWCAAVAGATSAQPAVRGGGTCLLEGVVRPGMPAPIHAARGATWRGRWGTVSVEVQGNTTVLTWPDRGVPRLRGSGAPPAEAFRPALLSDAVAGVLPEAARRWRDDPGRARRERAALAEALRRRSRFITLEPALAEMPAPTLSALDLLVALDRAELDGMGPVREWVGLGGIAVVLRGAAGPPIGLGRVMAWSTARGDPGLAGVAAERVPARPTPPPAQTGPVRVWAGLAALGFLALVAWSAGRRFRVVAGLLAVAGGVAILLVFPASAWTLRSTCSIWCFPVEGGRAWVHTAERVVPRGRAEARAGFESSGVVLTAVPSGGAVIARPGRVDVRWRGSGEVARLESRTLGGGFRIRRVGERTLVSARLPDGVELADAHLIRPGEMLRLGVLRPGAPVAVEEAARVAPDRVPTYLRSWLRGLVRRPPASGVILGELRGTGLRGRHFACVVPGRPRP